MTSTVTSSSLPFSSANTDLFTEQDEGDNLFTDGEGSNVTVLSQARTNSGPIAVPSQTTTESTVSGTVIDPTKELSKDIAKSQADANAILKGFVDKVTDLLTKYDKERDGYLEALKEARPVAKVMTADEWKGYEIQKAMHMANYNNGANDRGGHNKREANAINEIDNALTSNAMYLSYDQAIAMLKVADDNGLQKSGGTFEDGAWQGVFNSIRSFAQGAKQDYDQKLTAWQDRQNAAKAGLANVTGLITSTLNTASDTIKNVKSMQLSEAKGMYEQTMRQMQAIYNKSNTDKADIEEDEEEDEDQDVNVGNDSTIKIEVTPPNNGRSSSANGNGAVKITLNLNELLGSATNDSLFDSIKLQGHVQFN